MRSSHMIQGVMQWELRWCQKTWVQEKMAPKCKLHESIPLHTQDLNYETNVCELEDHVEKKGLNSN